MTALAALPIWGFMYVRALTAEPEVARGPLGVGAAVFTGKCSSCHGASGDGGAGYQLSDDEVWLTFPNIEDQIRFVYHGTTGYNVAGVQSYGDPNREGGAHTTGSLGVMPAWGGAGGELSDEEILAAVCHTRFALAGSPDLNTDEAAAAEFELWCAEEAEAFQALEEGTALGDLDDAGLTDAEGSEVEIIDIGTEPVEGSPAAE